MEKTFKMIALPKIIVICSGTMCSYKCIFCNNERMRKTNGTIILSYEKIADLLRSFPDAKSIDISGYGDIMLHPEFKKIMELAIELRTPLDIITTGEYLNKENQELFKRSALRRINFSLNSIVPETKLFLSGGCGDFDTVMNNFKEFAKQPRNYQVAISMVVNRHNFREMPEFVRFGIKHGINAITLQNAVSEIPYPEGFALINDEEEMEYRKEAWRIAKENNQWMTGLSPDPITGVMQKIKISKCRNPWNEAHINPDGGVAVCCFLSQYVIGNINNNTFTEIWNGDKATKLRTAILAGDDFICKKTCMLYEK